MNPQSRFVPDSAGVHTALLCIGTEEMVKWMGCQTLKIFPLTEATYLNAAESVLFFLTKAILTRPSHSWNKEFQNLQEGTCRYCKQEQSLLTISQQYWSQTKIFHRSIVPNQSCLTQSNTNGEENTSPTKTPELFFFVPRICQISCAKKADTWRKSI